MLRAFRYRAHGLTIDSEIELPELLPYDGPADVTVRYGAVPQHLPGEVFRGKDYEATPDQYLLDVAHIGRYLVTGGREVIVAPAASASLLDVRMLLMSSVMGALAHQRGLLPLHASSVDIDGRCAIFAGRPGAGKSTLTAAFHDRGYPIVSDDIAIVALDERSRPFTAAGYRRVKLLPDALANVGGSLGSRSVTRAGREKLAVVIPGGIALAPIPVARVFIFRREPADRLALRPLAGRAKASALHRQTYRSGIPGALGRRHAHFEQCLRISAHLDVTAVERQRGFERLEELVNAIEADVRAGRDGRHA